MTNTGKRGIELDYGNIIITDKKGRIYGGKDKLPGQFVSRSLFFIECEPGVTEKNYLYFTVPITAFEDEVYLGLISSLNIDKVQWKILIYDSDRSTYKFIGDERTFTSPVWEE